jgi:hypothetical protein
MKEWPVADDRTWWRIEAPHFTAGIRVTQDRVDHGAPILRWMLGKSTSNVASICRANGWTMECLKETNRGLKSGS